MVEHEAPLRRLVIAGYTMDFATDFQNVSLMVQTQTRVNLPVGTREST
jgi:hypothetical protein